MNHSPQQEEIVRHVRRVHSGSLLVEAVAGSGKTTVLLAAAMVAPDPTTLICAFNKRIADEMTARVKAEKLPRGRMIVVKTLHALGLQIIRDNRYSAELDVEATDNLVREVLPSANFPVRRAIVRLVRYLKETCTDWENVPKVYDLVAELGYADAIPDKLGDIITGAQEVMTASKQRRPAFDYCDMIWLPNALDLQPRGRFKLVMIDEIQDVGMGQFSLIERVLAPGGRIVAAGDPAQQIYEFRGSDVQAIRQRMLETHQARQLPLTWSFRCPKTVVAEAKKYCSRIESAPTAEQGQVSEAVMSDALPRIALGDFFLSRTNAGCVTAAIRAHLRGASVRVLGGYEVLDPILELLKKLDISSLERFRKALGDWFQKESAKPNLTAAQAERIEDRNAILSDAIKHVEPKKLAALFRGIFKDGGQPAAIFSTVHKAKGLEAHTVYLLRSSFSLFRPDKKGNRRTVADIEEEERNVLYVATTRAMNTLVWVKDDSTVDSLDSLDAKLAKTIKDHVNEFENYPPDERDITRMDIEMGLELPPEEP